MSRIFERYYNQYDLWCEKNKFTYLSELEAIREVLPKSGRGLEIGVGTGRFAQSLGIAIGIDPSNNMIRIAKKRGIDVLVGFGEYLSFKSNTFDYVAIITTLCFVRDPFKVLEETKRVLKKLGRVILCIIDKNSFLGRSYQKKESFFYKKAHFLSPDEVTALLKRIGFDIPIYYQTISTSPEKIKSIETPQKGHGRGSFVVMMAQKLL
jgi:ubiquinone/menaquinone biosynthesis C-methylase UbiE